MSLCFSFSLIFSLTFSLSFCIFEGLPGLFFTTSSVAGVGGGEAGVGVSNKLSAFSFSFFFVSAARGHAPTLIRKENNHYFSHTCISQCLKMKVIP